MCGQKPEYPAEAFLVLGDGARWSEVFRVPGNQVSTVGRDESNPVVLADTLCSRKHCQLSLTPDGWQLRDLGSSNGSRVNGERVKSEQRLRDGDIIRIGASLLLFTLDITQALEPGTEFDEHGTKLDQTGAAANTAASTDADSPVPAAESELEILARKSRSIYSEDARSADASRFPSLYGLVTDMVEAADIPSLAGIVVDGLVDILHADIGAVLLLADPSEEQAEVADLRLAAFRSPSDKPYKRPSDRLSSVALQVGDGLLALDVGADVSSGTFQTLEQMNARSVVCVPIPHEKIVFGLIHVYSLTTENSLDDQSLEFTLAVAEHMGAILHRDQERLKLDEGLKQVRDENRSLRNLLEIECDLVGESSVMKQLRDEIGRFAVSDSAVLIRGESGVGKELVARAVHFNSPRRDSAYVCLNCAALAETLLESELFGHERGSFTGATQRKFGKFEQAHGGTLFLDEVGEMSAAIQAKFLRVLEGHAFERVGGQKPIQVDVRVVAATNRDLEEAVQSGEFRKDLFFRLNILELEVPPLRDRAGDARLLAAHFMQTCAERQGRPAKRFSDGAMQLIGDHDWPGNVRELRNTVERAFALSRGDIIEPEEVRFSRLRGDEGGSGVSPDVYRPLTLQDMERRHIESTMIFAKWIKREAARILGIERSTLDRKLKSYDIDRPDA